MKNLLLLVILSYLATFTLSAQCMGPECCAPGTTWDPEEQLCVVFFSGDSNFDGCLATDDLLGFLSGFGECNDNYYDGPMFDCNGDGLITGIDNDCNPCECNSGENWTCSHLNDYDTYAVGFCDGCNCITLYTGDCNNDGEINELDAECAVDEGGCDCSQNSDCAWLNDSETGAWGTCDGCNCTVVYYDPLDCNYDGVIDGLDNDCNGTTDGGGCECETHFNCAHLNTETAVGVCDGCNCFTLEHGGLGGIIDCNGDGTIDGLDNDCNEATDCNGDGTFNELDYDCLIELIHFQCGFDQVNYSGYAYNTVQIGTQCWFAENCRYIPTINFQNDVSDTDPKYYVQNFTSGTYSQALGTANYNLYGVLYNWPAVNAGYVCPTGWHVATEFEHSLLINHLGGESVAGHSLKSLAYWDGSNASGFEAMPGSSIGSNGQFDVLNIGNGGYLWSSSVGDVSDEGISYRLNSNSTSIVKQSMENENGLSVRCLYGDEVVPVYGCTTIGYCNYDATANVDDGSCNHWEDICGNPCGSGVPAGDCDCNGNQFDDCGVCGGNNSTCFTQCGDDVEYEGYSYSTVQIGTQCWYAENNRYLPQVWNINDLSNTSPRYYEYVNSGGYSAVLYNAPAVNSPDICPSGWHMPIDYEWQQLEMTLGMSAIHAMGMGLRTPGGLELKSTTGWMSVSGNNGNNGNNSSGFNAKPDGRVHHVFELQDEFAFFWTSTQSTGSSDHSYARHLSAYHDFVSKDEAENSWGFSSRCLLGPPVFDIIGCTNPTSCNYEPLANVEDYSCLYPGDICNDNDPSTTGDIIQPDCSCLGTPVVQFNCGDDVNHENYDYSTVQIGSQCWFSENCRYLPAVSPSTAGSSTVPYYYVYGNTGTDPSALTIPANYSTYGVLYNWPAVMEPGICPSGWHIPTDLEWQTMEVSLGMSPVDAASSGYRGAPVGNYMKSGTGWNGGLNGTNSSGFDGLPGGYVFYGIFSFLGSDGYWWGSSTSGSSTSWSRGLHDQTSTVQREEHSTFFGFSARCIQD